MRALDRKLIRDLWGMKSQAVAIAFVLAGGVATFVMSVSTLDSLTLTQAGFYRDSRFAQVFGSLVRAPENLRERMEDIPGVQQVETRVIAKANLDIEDYPEPVTGRIISLPDDGAPLLNRLFIRRGRTVEAGRDDEVLVSETFADAHRLQPGDHLSATIYGRRRTLRIVGVALSPEYIYQLQPGAVIPDFRSYGVFWMARTPLENAVDMDGAFNDFAITVSPGARIEEIIERLDQLLAPYGGLGAYGREDQVSHRYLSEEFQQLRQMARIYPTIFLGVAVFLLNIIITRLIATQRENIAILKAFGYSNTAIAVHYLKLVVAIVLLGVVTGIVFGVLLGQALGRVYMDFYRFPEFNYYLAPGVLAAAVLISSAAAVLGTVYGVVRAALLPPAEAMQPPPPARYRISLVERLGLARWFSQPTRMILRSLERRPVKSFFSVVGLAFACAILVLGGFFSDAVDRMVNIQFRLAQRDDLTVTFIEATSGRALYELVSLPGVEYAEGFRSVPARLRYQHRTYRSSIQGIAPEPRLRRLLDRDLQIIELPSEGIVLTDHLARILGIRPGEMLTVEVLEGARPILQVPVAGLATEFVGVSAYMQMPALNRLMREGSAISGAYLTADSRQRQQVYSELNRMPRVAGVSVRETALRNFYDTMANQMLTFAFFGTLLAGSIAFGVVYNSARIALSERSRELASLRVLGFTRGEISYILLGELALLTFTALPLGFLIGRAMAAYMAASLESDLFRVPVMIDTGTYAFAAAAVLAASVFSALIVRRRLDRLDLVAVLKTKE